MGLPWQNSGVHVGEHSGKFQSKLWLKYTASEFSYGFLTTALQFTLQKRPKVVAVTFATAKSKPLTLLGGRVVKVAGDGSFTGSRIWA